MPNSAHALNHAGLGYNASMAIAMLATKLMIPNPRTSVVNRSQLLARLQRGLDRRVTLVAAPAGFGKTTLLSTWLNQTSHAKAWLTLDQRDNDPLRWLSYLVAALQTIEPTLGQSVQQALQAAQPAPSEQLLVSLINEIHRIKQPMLLLLDDYHVIENQAVDDMLNFLLEHMPNSMHLVVATREDPQIPLARLRARGQLNELRVSDLRFNLAESSEFLTTVMGLHLPDQAIAKLETRTEGWVAGLQLAALSLQGQHDPSSFIETFSGQHHFILDYLLSEVLHQQTPAIQAFLLQTSILERMTGPLCNAVLNQTNSQAILTQIDQANLFIVALDQQRAWYRYHQLFSDLLRQRLAQQITQPELAALHQRASLWYQQHDLLLEAFQHATLGHDYQRAEQLMLQMPLHANGFVSAMLNWLASLPSTVLDQQPSLWVRYAAILLVLGQTSGVEAKLQAAERGLQQQPDNEHTRDLIGQIAAARTTIALTQYQIETIIAQAQRAFAYLHPQNLPFRATTNWALAYAYQVRGERQNTNIALSQAIELSQQANDTFTLILALIGMGQLQESNLELYRAAATYRHVLQLAGEQPQQIIYEAQLGLARISYQWNDLAAAEQHAQQSLHLALQYEQGIDRFILCELMLSQIKLAHNDLAGAKRLLEQTEQLARQHNFVQRFAEIAHVRIQLLLREAKLSNAKQLATSHQLAFCQAQIALAQAQPAAAITILTLLQQQSQANNWPDQLVQACCLLALAYAAQGQNAQAIEWLQQALPLAEANQLIRSLLDYGPVMQQLLHTAQAHGLHSSLIDQALPMFNHNSSIKPQAKLVERLSEREIEVLQQIAAGSTDREIGERLYLSIYTVKVHARNIYAKLEVTNRTQAVARARSLGILPQT
ncbi:LuxR C-terminal-related transcriptional regulator [Herpetosiphon giganteus]|uniref:LuxR C-terminal-related transcriptional regulator n=1 Tax=Herpetosiphon giganteus TaxID=2029754 RepID=UPI001956F846|nr:LuxR C-terminal-related transcriptional regulator [Herpetosiphon giganteus]MBM7845455.1 LuxR family maltose regulon positive regulatory protein [Herpetosiphon giganteus]